MSEHSGETMSHDQIPTSPAFAAGSLAVDGGTMYHDQGMIPFKLMSFDEGVNFTAGLPVIRTSPAHGTAYDLAGKNEASPEAFRNAMYLAGDIFLHRQEYDELHANQLRAPGNQSENQRS